MVVIESIRVIIRPITLAVRLIANIVAGHLLLSLRGRGIDNVIRFTPLLVGQTALTVLEAAVACIQAYVFTVLTAIYFKEAYVKRTS